MIGPLCVNIGPKLKQERVDRWGVEYRRFSRDTGYPSVEMIVGDKITYYSNLPIWECIHQLEQLLSHGA